MKKRGSRDILQWIELVVFVVAIVLQNFAIYTTDYFGLAFSTAVLIYFFIRYRLYKKVDKVVILVVVGLGALLLLGGLVNSDIGILRIFRVLMIVFDAWCTYRYIEKLDDVWKSRFLKTFYWSYITICVYGIYEYFAQQNGWPRFLNIFSNNPSYGAMGIYAMNRGWSESSRIFTCFAEPSFYSIFLVYGFFLLAKFGKLSKKFLVILTGLFGVNLFLASARTGLIYLAIILLAILVDKFFTKKGRLAIKRWLKVLFILAPMMVLLVTHLAGLLVFKDLSIKGRSYSSVYYFEHSFDSVSGVAFGHGIKSMDKVADEGATVDGIKIERYAHNGYVEIMYQYGLILLIGVMILVIWLIEKVPEKNKAFMYGVIFALCCTGGLYSVETIMILTTVLYGYARTGKRYICEPLGKGV